MGMQYNSREDREGRRIAQRAGTPRRSPLSSRAGKFGALVDPNLTTDRILDKSKKEGVAFFGEAGSREQAAQDALPGILAMLAQQRQAQLQNVPTIYGSQPVPAAPPQGLFQSLASRGQQQIAAGQSLNPTLAKAKV